jgi:hypothetical protein
LKSHGKLVLVGALEKPFELPIFPLLMGNYARLTNFAIVWYSILLVVIELIRFVKIGRKMVTGSATGRIKEIQEMVDFAIKHDIAANIEVISMKYVNTVIECLAKSDVRY